MDQLTPFGAEVDLWVSVGTGLVMAWLVTELLLLHFWRRKLDLPTTRTTLLGILSNAFAGPGLTWLFGPFSVGLLALSAQRVTPFEAGTGIAGWVFGLFVYEFFYWLQHWLAHKVRLLWCIHSPHHAPQTIHMAVGANHHFIEGLIYFPIFLGFFPALCGVDPFVIVLLNLLDMVWGSFLHMSDEMVREGRYGVLGTVMQTPSHHRVHHGKNPRYLDRNYNSITLFWDWMMGTLETLPEDEAVVFGISRPVRTGSFWDVHFGEFRELFRDMSSAPSLSSALGYAFCPPGWKPGDRSKTAGAIRARWFAEHAPAEKE